MAITVSVFFRTKPAAAVKELEPSLRKAVRLALGAKKRGEVNLILEREDKIKRLNRRFLGHTGTTDVIAFNHAFPFPPVRGADLPFGDIYICLAQARRQAGRLGHSLETELLILAAHGALHLAGMDDSTARLRRAMNKKTLLLLRKL